MMSRHRQIKTITRALNGFMSSLPLFHTKNQKTRLSTVSRRHNSIPPYYCHKMDCLDSSVVLSIMRYLCLRLRMVYYNLHEGLYEYKIKRVILGWHSIEMKVNRNLRFMTKGFNIVFIVQLMYYLIMTINLHKNDNTN